MNNLQDHTADVPAGGTEIAELQNPVVSVLDAANTEAVPSPSVEAGPNALPWYLDMKYFWKRNRSGNGSHLAPQQDFIDSVIVEGDAEVLRAGANFTAKNSGDMELAIVMVKDMKGCLETLNAFDPAGVEAQMILRSTLTRVVLARKITGASQVTAMQRLINCRLTGQDEEKVKLTDYFQSDIINRDKWANKACFWEFVAREIADGEIIKDLGAQIISGVGRLLYDDAIQAGNRIRNPQQVSKKAVADVDMDAIRAAVRIETA